MRIDVRQAAAFAEFAHPARHTVRVYWLSVILSKQKALFSVILTQPQPLRVLPCPVLPKELHRFRWQRNPTIRSRGFWRILIYALYRDAVRAERIPDGRHERERVHDHRDGVFRVAAAIDGQRHGCGGTKEEMQRLLIDAEKLSGIKYDISSYADIVDAIHVVQTEMGITGTTALEASTTIQGSVAANTPLVR